MLGVCSLQSSVLSQMMLFFTYRTVFVTISGIYIFSDLGPCMQIQVWADRTAD